MPRTINTADLREVLQERPVQLLDVRLAEDFAAAHLPGAVNNCVFDVAFTERLAETIPDSNAPTVVYGANCDSHESRMAAEKLHRLGYAEILDYRDGIAAWRAEGGSTEEGPPLPPEPRPPHGTLPLDLGECRVEWTGRNLLNKHHGTVPLRSGELTFEHGTLTGGELVLDLTRLACSDLEGDKADLLVSHLQSDDFFDTGRFPEARFVLTGSEPLPEAAPGRPNLRLSGELTLRGITQPIAVDLATGIAPEGRPAAQGHFSIDRTRWGVLYGSGRFFQRLAGHLVNDLIDLEVRLVTA